MNYERRADFLALVLVLVVAGLFARTAQWQLYKPMPKVYSHLQWGPYIDLPNKPTHR